VLAAAVRHGRAGHSKQAAATLSSRVPAPTMSTHA
jgi:hypothetical protein